MKEIKFEISIPDFFQAKNWGQKRIGLSVIWVIAVFLVGSIYELNPEQMIILAYIGVLMFLKLSSRVSAFLALILIASEPFLLYLKNDALAETLAVYAFYFLVITVVQEIISLKKGSAGEL